MPIRLTKGRTLSPITLEGIGKSDNPVPTWLSRVIQNVRHCSFVIFGTGSIGFMFSTLFSAPPLAHTDEIRMLIILFIKRYWRVGALRATHHLFSPLMFFLFPHAGQGGELQGGSPKVSHKWGTHASLYMFLHSKTKIIPQEMERSLWKSSICRSIWDKRWQGSFVRFRWSCETEAGIWIQQGGKGK